MELARQLGAVALVLGLLALIIRALARRRLIWTPLGRRRTGQRAAFEVVDRLALAPQHTLHLVRVGPRLLVVACHPSGTTLLSECEPAGLGARAPALEEALG